MPPRLSVDAAREHVKRVARKRAATATEGTTSGPVQKKQRAKRSPKNKEVPAAAVSEERPITRASTTLPEDVADRPAEADGSLDAVQEANRLINRIIQSAGLESSDDEVQILPDLSTQPPAASTVPPAENPPAQAIPTTDVQPAPSEAAEIQPPSARLDKGKAPMAPGNEANLGRIIIDKVPIHSGSGIQDPLTARRILAGIVLPKDQELTNARTLDEIITSSYSAVIKRAHEITRIETGFHNLCANIQVWRNKAEKMAEEKAAAENLLRAAEEKAREANEKAAEAAVKLEETERRQMVASAQIVGLRKEAEKATTAAEKLREDRDATDKILHSQQKEIKQLKRALKNRNKTVRHLEDTISNGRRQLADRDARNQALSRDLEEARVMVRDSEARTIEEIKRATSAIENYKNSSEFTEDAVEYCADFWFGGFSDCKKQVAAKYPDLDLADIAFDAGDEAEQEAGQELEEGQIEESRPTEDNSLAIIPWKSPQH